MSEQLAGYEKKGEALDETETKAAAEHARKIIEANAESAKKSQESVEKIEERVEREATGTAEVEAIKKKLAVAEEMQTAPLPDRAGKQQALRTYLGQVRYHLSGPDQAFSKFVHNPTINSLSEAAGKTIIRPSGILTGGVFTLIGSGYYYFATKSTGYSYSFTIALLLFIGGFVVGVAAEIIYRILAKHQRG
jgi:hypothetical protein